MDWKNVLTRGLWTAAQAFVAVFSIAQIADVEGLRSAAAAGGAAALAAALSFIKTTIAEYLASKQV
jgi:hypothetical protein